MANAAAIHHTGEHGGLSNQRSGKTAFPQLSTGLLLGLGIVAIALIALAAGLAWHSDQQFEKFQHTYFTALSLLSVYSDLGDAEAREREYLLTGEPSYLGLFNSSRQALNEEFDRLRDLVKNNPREREETERLRHLVYQKLDELQQTVDTRDTRDTRATAGFEAARKAVLTDRGQQLMDAVRQDIHRMEAGEQNMLSGFSREWRWRQRTSLAALAASALLACCCLAMGRIALARSAAERQRAEEELEASDTRFETLCDQAPLGIYETDAEGNCVYTNRSWSTMSGLSASESLGHGWTKVLHPGDRDTVFEGWETAVQQGTTWEYRLLTGQGEIRWIRATGGPIYSERGELTGYVGTLEDVTERKQAEATLRESEERFRHMADTAPVLIWVSGPDKGCIFFNKVWLEFTGRTMEQELGVGWTKGVHPEDRDRCMATYSASFDARLHFRMEYRLRRADGEYRWILDDGAPRFTQDDLFSGYIGSCIDITERKRAEEEVQKFMSLTERSLEFVCMWDLELRPFYVNPAGLRLVGLDNLEAACRIKVQEYFFPEDQPFIINEFFPRVLRDGHGEVEIRVRHFKTGEPIWMIYNVLNILDASGAAVGWATVSTNITERRRAEGALKESRQELRALAGRLFLAQEEERKRISRELHDDLSQKVALLAFDTSSLVLESAPLPEETKKSLCNLQTRIGELATDVRQIAHRLHPSILEDLGLAAALRELCEEFSARTTIQAYFEEQAPTEALPLDVASCLYRVAQEALHNVLKHSRASHMHLTVSGNPKYVRLSIRDNGIGFASEGRSTGHGLGIIGMQERVRLVEGEFSIYSQPGQGTTLVVSVPLPRSRSEAHANSISG